MKTKFLFYGICLGIWFPANAQLTWQEQECPITTDLISVSFVDTNRGWAIGKNGEIIRTTDGGKVWELASNISNLEATKVFFINETTGWATGFSSKRLYGRVLHTTNGGETWINGMDSLSIFFNDVFFFDENRGWIVGYDTIADTTNYIMYTSNGGITWERQMEDMFLAGAMISVHFRDSVNGNIVGSGGFFLHTSTGGEGLLDWWLDTYNWQIAMTDVYNVGDEYGCMIGAGGIAYFTTDDWNSKKLDYELPIDDSLWAISGTDNLKFWAVGDNGSIINLVYSPIMHLLIITDQSFATINRLNDVKAVTDSNVWVVGNNGTILHYGINSPDNPIVTDNTSLPNLEIYPNPVGNLLAIFADNPFTCRASIFSYSGIELVNTEISIPSELDLSNFAAGIYILKLNSGTISKNYILIKN